MLFNTLKNKKSLFLIAGPCVVESEEICYQIAQHLSNICARYNITYIFKASYKKANRTSVNSFTGIGDIKALEIINKIGKSFSVPTLTDVHTQEEVKLASGYVDVLQIPAFLCRQTDLLVEAGKTGKIVNIKKGQFASPQSMQFAAEKVSSTGNTQIMLTERGTTFGYEDLVVDFRGIPIMQQIGYPVILDITHSLQKPNQSSGVTGGLPHLIETIAKAGVASGVDGIFLETHPSPSQAKSDGANMLSLDKTEKLLQTLINIKNSLNL